MPRAPWDDYFLRLAFMAAERATCPRRHVGAVLVQGRRVCGTGYNGSPAGVEHCTDVGCLIRGGHCVRTIHAEANVILSTDAADRTGATIYCTDRPCLACTNMLANSGVVEIVYTRPYLHDEEIVNRIFEQAGVLLRQL